MKQILDFREQQGEYLGYDQISEQKCKNFRCKGDLRYWVLGAFSKKILFSSVKEFFSCIMISKMGVKMSFMIITKNHATDSKIRFLQKIYSRAGGPHEFHPTAWDLDIYFCVFQKVQDFIWIRIPAFLQKLRD